MNLYPIRNHFEPTSILDIGANEGWFYKLALKEFPTAHFCLVDANPNCEPKLRDYGTEYHIRVLSDSVNVVDFYTAKDSPTTTGASMYRENTGFFSDDNIIVTRYETTTLDILFENRIFDLIKMDVQGAELDIIKGGPKVISKCKGLLLELSSINYNEGAPLENEVINYLKTINFEQVDVLDGKSVQRPHHYDALFVNRNI